ncbi:MAG: hypothetical protein GOMPHAMPRED_003820 [Gomphillus americanus]|uniref:Karyogamy protein n=1 Tax=Gomphillus americanus TaxID=1940652 RepID=A0A8H3FIG8_9LECA|nr:MAG: hypothetical protein GOMPHAMPRED_003820 [Gomphillus americanus]
MADVKDARRTPTKRTSTSSKPSTPRSSKHNDTQRPVLEDDLPLPPADFSKQEAPNLDAYFLPLPPSRAASIYSVNRATLAGQLSQLTSTDLPDADSLAARITNLPTAAAAAKALTNSAQQIKSWIRTAAEVLGGLDARDDVEWAGVGSKDGVADVDAAIKKFEKLVLTYITAVEDAQKRPDIATVAKSEMTTFLDTLEDVIASWEKVKQSLQTVKTQNELAVEWEDIWNNTLGEIGQEIESLSTLVFELEEKRYLGDFDDLAIDHAADINELETIVEESTAQNRSAKMARQAAAAPGESPLASPGFYESEHSGLLTLVARMQPLRASLDFLPMQLTKYESKAGKIFPSACSELQARRQTLEAKYATLEKDVKTLREELGEDKWVVVFRTASKQALKMCASIEKSAQKLVDTLQDEAKASNTGLLAKRISDYEGKRNNYRPAIRKVMSMIERGVKDRMTVNGEVLRIHEDTNRLWSMLENMMTETDAFLEEAQAVRDQQLRDSISTIISADMSSVASTVDTPNSSQASSPSNGPADKISLPATPELNLPRNQTSSMRSLSSSRAFGGRRVTSQPTTAAVSTRRQSGHIAPLSRLSTASPSPAPHPPGMTPMATIHSSRTATPGTATASKPRWSVGVAVDRKLLDQRAPITPTAYARRLKESKPSVYSLRSTSSSAVPLALPSPLPYGPLGSRNSSLARATSSLGFRPHRDVSPSPSMADSVGETLSSARPRSRLYRPSLPAMGATTTPSSVRSMSYGFRNTGTSRRTSMLPLPTYPMSPSPMNHSFADAVGNSANGSVYSFEEEEDVLPSIEHDITSPTPAASARRNLPIRPASSLAHIMGDRASSRPPIVHTRASLLRASSVTPHMKSMISEKPRWRG